MRGDVPASAVARVARDARERVAQRGEQAPERSRRGSSRAPIRTRRDQVVAVPARRRRTRPASARLPRGIASRKPLSCSRTVASSGALGRPERRDPCRRPAARGLRGAGRAVRVRSEGQHDEALRDRTAPGCAVAVESRPTASRRKRTVGCHQAEVDRAVRGGRRRGARRDRPVRHRGVGRGGPGAGAGRRLLLRVHGHRGGRGGGHARRRARGRPGSGRLLRRDGPAREDAAQRHGDGEDAGSPDHPDRLGPEARGALGAEAMERIRSVLEERRQAD